MNIHLEFDDAVCFYLQEEDSQKISIKEDECTEFHVEEDTNEEC